MSAMTLVRIGEMAVADRLTALRERAGLSKNALAKRAEIAVSTVSRIEAGVIDSPGRYVLVQLAGALGVSIAELTGESEPKPQLLVYSGVVWVPYVERSVHAGVDAWREGIGRTPLSEEEARGHRRLYAGRVTGSCMVPDVLPGATVIWDPDMRHPTDGQQVVVSHQGELMVKLAYRDDHGDYLLVSNDGQEIRPNGYVLEGLVVKVTNDPRRGPRSLAEFRRQRAPRDAIRDPE